MNNHNKKYYQTLLITLTLLIVHSSLLIATVRFVSKTGSSEPPYLTWETAADSIQKCINISVFGDTIYVANGVYEEQVVMIPGLSLIGAGMDSCIIDTRSIVNNSEFRSVEVADSCRLKGFHIIVYSNFNMGRGIYCLAGGLVTQNKVENGISGINSGLNTILYQNSCINNRNGIYVTNSNSLVRQNTFTSNYIGGVDIQIQAFDPTYFPIIDSNYIEVSKPSHIGILKHISSSPVIKNNIIILTNGGSIGIQSNIGGSSNIFNNLIIAQAGFDGIYKNGSIVQVINNYLLGAFGDYGILASSDMVKNNVVTGAANGIGTGGSSGSEIQYNNSWNNGLNYPGFSPDSTNLSVDPMIVNDDTTQGDLDFHLQKYSPLIDAGDPNILDRDGSRSDIGLYGGSYGWTYTYNDLAPRPPHNVTAAIEDGFVKLTWNKNTESDFSYYRIYRDTVTIVIYDSSKIIGETPDTVFYDNLPPVNHETRFYYVITAFDNQGNQSYPSEEINVLVTGLGEYPPKGYDGYRLLSNYPNPFNPSTIIPYRLKEGGYVKLYVYDVKGELVRVLVNEWQERGYYEVMFQPNANERSKANSFEVPMGKTYSDIATGVYLYMIQVYNDRNIPVFSDSGKMILLK
jgi:hypothetical protein